MKKRFIDIPFVQKEVTIGGKTCFFKSTWEINYARWLEWLKQDSQIRDWLYEPEVIHFHTIKRGTMYYTPDFKVLLNDGSFEYHEVKGYMDAKSRTKLKRFLKYYPNLKIKLVKADWFKKHREALKAIIPEWI